MGASKILHVGTDPQVPKNLNSALTSKEGRFEVVTKTHPEDVLGLLRTDEFDCLVSAYELPGMDGIELLDAVRDEDEQLPIILFPRNGDERIASCAISAGVTDYIRQEQDNVDSLANRVQEVVNGGQTISESDSQYDRNQFERFLQAFPDAIFVMDENGRYVDYITGGDRSLLYDDLDALLGRRYHEVLPEETADRFLGTIQQALTTSTQQQIEYQLDVKKGQRWFEARVGPLDTQTEPRTVFWIARDITERKQREREYEQIYNNVNDAIAVFDPATGDIVDVNETYHDMLGYEDLETIQELGIEGLSVTDEGYTGERGTKLIREVNQSGNPITVDWQGVTKEGDKLWLESTLAPAEIGGNERVLSIQRDITERRKLRQTYRDIFENVSDGLVIHDPWTGEILEVNEEYCELTGYSREELLEGSIRQIMPDDPNYTYEEVIKRIKQAREQGPQLFEFKAETKNGDIFIGDVHLRTIEIRGEERVLASVRDITERKRRKQEYEQIFNGVNDVITIHDTETAELVEVNETFCDLLGYEREEILDMGITGYSPTEDGYTLEQAQAFVEEVLETDGPQHTEWVVETRSGETRWLDVKGTTVEIGGETQYVSISRDITERRRREREYEQIFNNVNDIIAIHDRETGELIDTNQRMCEVTGYDKEQVLELGAQGLVHSHPAQDYTPDEIPRIIERVMNGEEIEPYQQALETKDGGLMWVEVNPTRAVINGEERFLAISRDVTERRRREREYEQIFNNVNDIIAVRDPDTGQIIDANQSYSDLLGYDREEMRGMTISDVGVSDEGYDDEEGRKHLNSVMESDEPVEFEWKVEGADGQTHLMDVRGTAVQINGEDRYLAIGRDITERKHREQRLEVFNRILRHNLRNQIDVIRSHAEVLTDETTDDHAERIIAAVDQLAAIGARARKIDQIMSMDDSLSEINLDDALRKIIASMEDLREDVEVTTELPTVPPLRTNEEAVSIAVESAFENALEHAESSVTVSLTNGPNGYTVTIDDDGPGIPDDELAPIQTRNETNLKHGRGLGLWQLRWSVDKFNGELSFDSADGTTVRITIPDTSL